MQYLAFMASVSLTFGSSLEYRSRLPLGQSCHLLCHVVVPRVRNRNIIVFEISASLSSVSAWYHFLLFVYLLVESHILLIEGRRHAFGGCHLVELRWLGQFPWCRLCTLCVIIGGHIINAIAFCLVKSWSNLYF